jgi:hypothetical protein
VLRWSEFAATPYAAMQLLRKGARAFNHHISAMVWPRDPHECRDNCLGRGKVTVWQHRIDLALARTQKHHGFDYDRTDAVLIRTRFDMLPDTYPVFSTPLRFMQHEARPIIFAANTGDCQPDLHSGLQSEPETSPRLAVFTD